MNEIEKIFYDFEKYFNKRIRSMFDSDIFKNFFNDNSLLKGVNIQEKDNKVYVDIQIPQFTKEHNLKIDLADDSLIVYGNLEKSKDIKSDYGHKFKETYSEYFYRVIPMPVRVTKKDAKAEFYNNLLRINLNKIGELEDRNYRIDIDYK